MGKCIFCNQWAGLLQKKHDKCDKKFRNGFYKIAELVNDMIIFGAGYDEIDILVDQIARDTFNQNRKREAILRGWDSSVGKFLENGVLSVEEEKKINIFQDYFKFSAAELNQNNSYLKVVQSKILRSIMNGGVLADNFDNNLPIKLQKTEKIIYVFNDVDYYVENSKKDSIIGYGGSTSRIAKGVYYRSGAFNGRSVAKSEITYVDHGIMEITNKHIYFQGSSSNFRIWFNRIDSFYPYADGFGLLTDNPSAKPHIFVVGDGWFVYNLITNISNLYIQ